MSRPPLPDSLRPTLPPVASRTPSKIDITSQPGFITNHTRGTQDNLGVEILGTHQQADKLIDANLDGATYFNIEGLVKAAIPEDAFPLDDSLFLDAVCDAGLYNKERGRWQCQPKLRKPGEYPVIADWLNAIGEAGLALFVKHGIFSSDDEPRARKWSAAFCDKELPGGVQSRKPDGASFDPLTEASWKVIINDLQHKSSSEDREAAFKQLHDGAFNILTEQDDRIFHIGLALIGEQFFIVYYNRAGCYRSIPANVHEHAAILVYLVFALALLDKPAVGFDPSIAVTEEGRFITLAGRMLRILGPQGREYNLRGSSPKYWRCIDTATNEKFTVKNVWADRSRNPTEWELYERADRAGVEHMPKIVACEFVRNGEALITTDTLRQRLPNPSDVKDCEVRDYMRILIEGHTVPLHDFASKSEVIGAVRDAVKAHQMLCDKAGIIHLQVRDTTVLLDDSDGSKRGSRHGVLVDLGVAKVIDLLQAQPPSRGHKSCFGMYEAWEILTSPNAMPRSDHDLESFFYVLIALCSSCSGDDKGALPREDFDLPKSNLGRWLDIDKARVGHSKWFVLSFKPKASVDSFDEFLNDVIDPFFDDFKPLLRKLRELLAEVSRRPTHQEFIDVLESYVEAKLPTATLPTVDAENDADEDDEGMSDSDDDQFDDDSDAGHTADRDRLPDVAQVLAVPVPRERRESTQARAARFSPYTVDMMCECGEILRLGDSDLIRCREPSCSTGLFHRDCMGKLREPPADSLEAWCCDNCKGKKPDRDYKPLPKKRARADAM
ncbi:hypothetical protein EV122DRAFT_283306 [Schizophyllum commune]